MSKQPLTPEERRDRLDRSLIAAITEAERMGLVQKAGDLRLKRLGIALEGFVYDRKWRDSGEQAAH